MNFIKYFKASPLSQKIFYLIMVVFGCVFFTTVIGNHYYFRTYAFDYAVYNFAFWDYAHFHMNTIPCNQVYGNLHMTFIQDHFSLTLMYFTPVYWLLNWLTGTYTLLIILVALILWSGWAIYRLIRLKTNDEWLAVLAVLYYFLLQGRYSSFAADSNIFTMICCLVPLFLLCFELKKYVAAFSLLILLLFSREDMPLWFIFIFTVLGSWHWKEKRIVAYCLGGILLSLVYFIVLFKVFIPMTETPGKTYALFQYSALGKTPWEALIHCIQHPIETFKLLYTNQSGDHTFDGVKKEFYWVYFISGGFILFFRPQYFIWFIPLVAQKMFNDDQFRWGITLYYCIPIVTLLPISVFTIISKVRTRWAKYSLAAILCVLAFSVTAYKMNIHHRALVWGTTTKENIFDPTFFHPDYDASKINSFLTIIPPDAKICASESILPHLSQRLYAYEFPDVEDAEYIAAFTFRNYYLTDEDAYSSELNKYIFSSSWSIIAHTPSFVLLKKTSEVIKNNDIIDSIECGAETISPDKLHFTTSDEELLDNADARDSSLKHTGGYSICLNEKKPYGFTYHGVNFKPGDRLKITVWKYPAAKDTGKLVASCGKGFYKVSSWGTAADKSGWAQLQMYVTVPDDCTNLLIYVMNNAPADVWFDDMKIVRCSLK